MKKILFILSVLFSLNIASAQSPLMATLDHNGEITHFFSTNALVNAMKVAQDGDIITLSSGAFVGTDITKSITIKGAGMDDVYGDATIIKKQIYITATDTTHNLIFENMRFEKAIVHKGVLKNAKFKKCYISQFSLSSSEYVLNGLTIENCRVQNLAQSGRPKFQNLKILNSVISHITTGEGGNTQIFNSILRSSNSINYAEIWNSILIAFDSYAYIPETSTAYNCLGYTNVTTDNIFVYISNSSNSVLYKSSSSIFLESDLNSSNSLADFTSFELTEDVKSTYLGADGTEVGVYGGFLPYTSRPAGPKITKCNVAQKSTVDGKLSVEIEVTTQE